MKTPTNKAQRPACTACKKVIDLRCVVVTALNGETYRWKCKPADVYSFSCINKHGYGYVQF